MSGSYSSADLLDVLQLFDNGFMFEKFGQEFLSAYFGCSFMAGGGVKDRGIDGLEYALELQSNDKKIYQLSINKNPENKISDSLDKLKRNKIDFDIFIYVTNIVVKHKDILIDKYYRERNINVRIYDGKWIADNSSHSPATQKVISDFIRENTRQFQKPGHGMVVSNYVSDPRLYVYLMQQIGRSKDISDINESLIDSLILYSLRETDPNKDIFMAIDEIYQSVKSFLNYEMNDLRDKITYRLRVLTRKPRRVNHHVGINKYCLPYETRLEILANNAHDIHLYDKFYEEATSIISKFMAEEGVAISDVSNLLYSVIEKIYYKQGLEFADFLLNVGGVEKFEGDLSSVADEVVLASGLSRQNHIKIKNALILSIRELIYHGTPETKEYLMALSKTYLMLFLLKCEPKVVEYFQTMASKLQIYVCTSILVPAFSEIYLEDHNRRYWSLLKAAKARGVKLIVNGTIINELDFHIKRSKYLYDTEYKENMNYFMRVGEEVVDQILIRAYIYAVREKKVGSYDKYVDNFITINGADTKQELIDFLHQEFGIEYVSDEQLGVEIDRHELERLVDELAKIKKSREKAKTDSDLILTIYGIRKANSEQRSTVDGYKTWWLSSDTATHKAVSRVLRDKYPVSCYMRPDFLYNYICLAPSKDQVSKVYKDTFPNLLGIQMSNHIPAEIAESIRSSIKEHADKLDGRVVAKIRNLIDELKSNHNIEYRSKLKSFFS